MRHLQITGFAQPDWRVRKNRPQRGATKNGLSSTSAWHDTGLPAMLSTLSRQRCRGEDAVGSTMLNYSTARAQPKNNSDGTWFKVPMMTGVKRTTSSFH